MAGIVISTTVNRVALVIAAIVMIAAIFETSARAEAKPDPTRLVVGPITISAAPITSFNRGGVGRVDTGKLEFLGGLVLTAPDNPYFGGWSGLAFDADGKSFVSVSDSGIWLTGTLIMDGAAPKGIENARIGPLLGLDGKPHKRPRDRDAEAITLIDGAVREGKIQIAFEQNARIAQYDITRNGISPTRKILAKPSNVRALSRNAGLESMTVMRGGPYKGETIAIAERFYNRARNHTGWIWTGGKVQPFFLTNIGDYDVTDIASLDDGSLFVLERRFRWLEGVKMRIRRVEANELAPGKTAAGDILIEANLEHQIDNMEGLAVTRSRSGDIILSVISDDNYNRFLQRTLLLQFALQDKVTQKSRP